MEQLPFRHLTSFHRRSSSALFICRLALEGYRVIVRDVASDDLTWLFRWRRGGVVSTLTNLEKPLVRYESPWHG